MKIIPLFILPSGQVAVQVNDDAGNILTQDIGIGRPFGMFHLTEISKLKKWAAENNEEVDLPNSAKSYDYLPRIDDDHLENLIIQLKKTRVTRSQKYSEKKSIRDKLPFSDSQNKKYKPYETKGDFDYCSGNYAQAIEHYRKVLKISPENTHALAFIGHCYFRLGKKGEAAQCYNNLKEVDPVYTDIVLKTIKSTWST